MYRGLGYASEVALGSSPPRHRAPHSLSAGDDSEPGSCHGAGQEHSSSAPGGSSVCRMHRDIFSKARGKR